MKKAVYWIWTHFSYGYKVRKPNQVYRI